MNMIVVRLSAVEYCQLLRSNFSNSLLPILNQYWSYLYRISRKIFSNLTAIVLIYFSLRSIRFLGKIKTFYSTDNDPDISFWRRSAFTDCSCIWSKVLLWHFSDNCTLTNSILRRTNSLSMLISYELTQFYWFSNFSSCDETHLSIRLMSVWFCFPIINSTMQILNWHIRNRQIYPILTILPASKCDFLNYTLCCIFFIWFSFTSFIVELWVWLIHNYAFHWLQRRCIHNVVVNPP